MLMDARAPEQIKNPYIAALITAYVGIFSSTPCPLKNDNSIENLWVTKRYSKQVFCIKMYCCQQKITAATESSVAAAFYFKALSQQMVDFWREIAYNNSKKQYHRRR